MDYALIGHSISHSYSKRVHNLLGNNAYEIIDLPPGQLDGFLNGRRFKGINVTIPYKKEVLPYCAELSDAARRIGSVNTILAAGDGSLYGDNTDYSGFMYMCRRTGISFGGQRVVILGSGGTSLTAQAAAADNGAAETVVVSRGGYYNYTNLELLKGFDIIINTTPVGMSPNTGTSLLDLRCFPNCRAVIDVIYNPLRTKLLLDAASLGIPHTNGLPMLIAQAASADSLFFGKAVEDAVIREVLARLTGELTNIVLIGMPGCGKTTVAAQLAKLLGRTSVDTDELIEARENMEIPRLITSRGERAFRKIESEVVRDVSKMSGIVISTGGGAVLSDKNRQFLRQNGWVVWLQRPIEKLEVHGRPLSKDLHEMYAIRKEYYTLCRDFTVVNDSDVLSAAEQIKEAYYEAAHH